MNPNIKEGTPEWDVIRKALDLVVYCPLDIKTPQTLVRTEDITDLRAILDRLGIDWRAVKAT